MNLHFIQTLIFTSLSALALSQSDAQQSPLSNVPPSGLIWSQGISDQLEGMSIQAMGIDEHQLELVSLNQEEGFAEFAKTLLQYSGVQLRESTESDPTTGIVFQKSRIKSSADQAFFSEGFWFLWDSQGKKMSVVQAGTMNLDVLEDSAPDELLTTFPLQFDSVDDIIIAWDTVFALGQLGQETLVAFTPLEELSESSQWTLPGPLPDIREQSQLVALENRLLVIGGKVPSNETYTYPRQNLYCEYSEEGISSFAPLFTPMPEAPGEAIAVESNKMFFVWGMQNISESNPISVQYAQEFDPNKLGIWTSYPIQPDGTPKYLADFEAEHRLIMLTESESGEQSLECFIIPRSKQLETESRDAHAIDSLMKFNYPSITAALRRPNPEQNPFLLVTYPEGSEEREKLETLFRNPNAQIMMRGVQLAAPIEQDQQFMEKLLSDEKAESKIFLISHEGIAINAADHLESTEEMFKLLNAIWRPVR